MKTIPLALLFCSLCLSVNGCGGNSSNPIAEPTAKPSASGNPANDRFLALTEREQQCQLSHTVGEGCVGNMAFYMGTDPNPKYLESYWSVGCSNGRELSSIYRAQRENPCSGLRNLEEYRDAVF